MITSLGDSFGWPFKDPAWLSKIVVQGLISIIPIIGWIALAGWMLTCLDNLRAGRNELAPAGFYLERGIGLFGALLIYGLAVYIPSAILGAIGGGLVGNQVGIGGLFIALAYLIELAGGLLILFLAPSLIGTVWESGFSAGLNVSYVWQRATANLTNSVLTALIILAADIIAGFGIILCCVGVLFTNVWYVGVSAAAIFWFLSQQPPTATPYTTAPPPPPTPPAPPQY